MSATDYFEGAAAREALQAERERGRLKVRRARRAAWWGWAVAGVATAGFVAAGLVAIQGVRNYAVVDANNETVQWVRPRVLEPVPLLASQQEAFVKRAVRCMEEYTYLTWRWNFEVCRAITDPEVFARQGRRFVKTEEGGMYSRYGKSGAADVVFGQRSVTFLREKGVAIVRFTKREYVGGVRLEKPWTAEVRFEQRAVSGDPFTREMSPSGYVLLPYQSDAEVRP